MDSTGNSRPQQRRENIITLLAASSGRRCLGTGSHVAASRESQNGVGVPLICCLSTQGNRSLSWAILENQSNLTVHSNSSKSSGLRPRPGRSVRPGNQSSVETEPDLHIGDSAVSLSAGAPSQASSSVGYPFHFGRDLRPASLTSTLPAPDVTTGWNPSVA